MRRGKVAAGVQAGYPQLVVCAANGRRGCRVQFVRGWQVAGGDILATINADFQHPPELLPKMLEMVRTADLVVATRLAAAGSFGENALAPAAHFERARRAGHFLVPQIFSRVSDPLSGYVFAATGSNEVSSCGPTGFKDSD